VSTIPKTAQPVKTAPVAPVTPTPRPATAGKSYGAEKSQSQQLDFLFDKENYMLMLGGIGLILLGFFLMAGGKSANPHEFHYDEIYSFRRITIAPIVLLMGFGLEVYAIMKKPKEVAA